MTVAQHVGRQSIRYAIRCGLRVVVVVRTGPDFRLQVADIGRAIAVLAAHSPAASLLHLVVMVRDEIRWRQFPFAPPHEDAHEDDDQEHDDDGQTDAHDDYQRGCDGFWRGKNWFALISCPLTST